MRKEAKEKAKQKAKGTLRKALSWAEANKKKLLLVAAGLALGCWFF